MLEGIADHRTRDRGRHTVALTLFRRRATYALIDPAPIPVPRFSIDGWTFSGTPAAATLGSLPRQDLRDLETLLHGVDVQVDTPYTYERAAVLLERAGEHGPALSVCEAWLAHPASRWPEYTQHTRAMEKHKARLRVRLKPVSAAAR
jgi:hypothetical protein